MVKGLVVQADPARETRGLLGLGAGAPPRRAGRGRSGGCPARPPLRARDAAGSPGRAPAAPSLVKFASREREAELNKIVGFNDSDKKFGHALYPRDHFTTQCQKH